VTLLTVGHGRLEQDGFATLLTRTGVSLLVDVRRSPGSRRHPHVNRGVLERWLPDQGIAYRWEEVLGGRRPVAADSAHVALADEAFRGYADHMASEAFSAALSRIIEAARERTVALMCAEADWRRCHRQMIADALVLLHDVEVTHLGHDGELEEHRITGVARRVGERVVYDGGAQQPGLFDA
jgi:uncharacterized protein (DUF488 family)